MVTDKYTLRRYDTQDISVVDTEVLESLPFEYTGSATEVVYETEEFTSVCPWTGLPDFGHMVITYQPGELLVELKSLKYYLTSFRNIGVLQEHVVNKVLKDLILLLEPNSMVVETWFNERGGLSTHVRAQHPG
jgi:7-cyano-7-deazaguanine reductase